MDENNVYNAFNLFGQQKHKPVINPDKDRSLSGKKRVKARRREHRESKKMHNDD